jgi:hypothetical protein
LEPWNNLSTSLEQSLESSVNFQRRSVHLTIKPIHTAQTYNLLDNRDESNDMTDPYSLAVEVRLERHQVPHNQLTGSCDGKNLINTLTSVPAELRTHGISGPYWEMCGRDSALEEFLLTRILHESQRPDIIDNHDSGTGSNQPEEFTDQQSPKDG